MPYNEQVHKRKACFLLPHSIRYIDNKATQKCKVAPYVYAIYLLQSAGPVITFIFLLFTFIFSCQPSQLTFAGIMAECAKTQTSKVSSGFIVIHHNMCCIKLYKVDQFSTVFLRGSSIDH